MTKYEPLTAFLKQTKRRNIRLSFAEIEKVLGFFASGIEAASRLVEQQCQQQYNDYSVANSRL